MRNSSRGKIQGCKMPRAIRCQRRTHLDRTVKDEEGAGRSVALVRGGGRGVLGLGVRTCRGEKSQGNEQEITIL